MKRLQVTAVEPRYEKTLKRRDMSSVRTPVEQLLDIYMLIKITQKKSETSSVNFFERF